jgi:LacI family repressor for deo operon, udp, cdd, tsx, nupC, and nupG
MAVRLREVAERAGVSARSVSNVINGFRYVSPAMREKVQTAIDELDYRPNLLARSLRSGRTGTIGFLLPEISAPYFGELAHQVVEQSQGLGLNVLIDETGPFSGRELTQLDAMSRSGNVDGILLSALEFNARQLSELRPRIPVVLLGERTAANSALDHVGIDNVAAAREITCHLFNSGRSRIAAVSVLRACAAGATSDMRQ